MTRQEFVDLCNELLPLGATEVSAGIFKASFRPAQQPGARREPPPTDPSKPPQPQSPEDARHGYYNRVMGGR